MSNTSNTIIKIIAAGALMFGMYKLYKALEKENKAEHDKIEEHRKEVIEEIKGELDQAEQWSKSVKDITLNNENLNASDRAYAYELFNEKFLYILKAKTIKEIDDGREDLEEYVDIFMTTKDPETIHALLQIGIDRKNKIEQEKAAKEAREADLEKYKALGNVIEKIGSKVVCDLVQ